MSSNNIPYYHDLNVTYSGASNTTGTASVHYIEAGDPHLPLLLLLHGFPSSSYEFRNLIPMLSDTYHVLAPDYPGFGLTTVPDNFVYTFANIAIVLAAWLAVLGVKQTAMYIHDYGAPVGLRLATTGATNVSAIISQNGNLYDAGFGAAFWAPVFAMWNSSDSQASREAVQKGLLTLEGTKGMYVTGTPQSDLDLLDPETWNFNYLQNIQGSNNSERQLDLLYDYRTNVRLYPKFHEFLRTSKVPILAVWGKNDPAFIPAGAEAFLQDAPNTKIEFVDAGHFALEEKRWEIARFMKQFLTSIGY